MKIQFIKKELAFILSTVLIGACTQQAFFKADTKFQMMSTPRAVTLPTIGELLVGETKISGEATGKITENINLIKEKAVNNALRPSNADILIEPVFETTTYKGLVTIKVFGYAGHYKNFRTVTLEDSSFLKYYLEK
jgi:hypothetical protein